MGGEGSGDGGSGEPAPSNATFVVTSEGAALLAAHQNGAIASASGGDVIVAAYSGDAAGGSLWLARLGSSAEVRWIKSLTALLQGNLPSHVIVEGERAWVITSSQSTPVLQVIEVNAANGEVERGFAYDAGCVFPARGRALAGGGLVISCSGNSSSYVRLDEALDVVWAKRGKGGGDVVVLDDGFAFVGISMSNRPVNPDVVGGPAVGTGAGIHLTDEDGNSRGWSFMGPGPGIHSLAGARLLPDGNIFVALGVDSTRSDSPTALSPAALAIFDGEGAPVKMQSVRLSTVFDGRSVPLQFGSGHSIVARGSETWVAFVANSGALGADVRSQVVARFGLDGAARDAAFGGVQVAATTGDAALSFTLVSPQPNEFSLLRSAPGDESCTGRPDITVTEVEPYLDSASAAESPLVDVSVTVTELEITSVDRTGTTTNECVP